MVVTLFIAVGMFSVMYVAMMSKLVELGKLEEQVILADRSSTAPVAGSAVTAPSLGVMPDEPRGAVELGWACLCSHLHQPRGVRSIDCNEDQQGTTET